MLFLILTLDFGVNFFLPFIHGELSWGDLGFAYEAWLAQKKRWEAHLSSKNQVDSKEQVGRAQ